jgi:hypothetical protein
VYFASNAELLSSEHSIRRRRSSRRTSLRGEARSSPNVALATTEESMIVALRVQCRVVARSAGDVDRERTPSVARPASKVGCGVDARANSRVILVARDDVAPVP